MADLWENYVDGWNRALDFKGKSNRAQYWTFWLINLAVTEVLAFIFNKIGATGIMGAVNFIFFVVQLSIDFRRLHDTGRSAWNLLWVLLPIIGWIILLVYFLQPSKAAE